VKTDQINMLELRTDLTGILKRASAGEMLVITRFGQPVAAIGPITWPVEKTDAGQQSDPELGSDGRARPKAAAVADPKGSARSAVAPDEVIKLPDNADELTALKETRRALVKRYGANHTDVHEITDRINKLSK
jgi:antitoxin (DNA-binding transcriptional repressor) of toxin-antitoxin stability system